MSRNINDHDLRTDATMAAVEALKQTRCMHHPNDATAAECEACMAEVLEGYKAGTGPPTGEPTLAEKIEMAIADAPTCQEGNHDRNVQLRGDCSDCKRDGTSKGFRSRAEIIADVLTDAGIEG